jgi:uncharacterized membrane protein YkvA (DUF1232 family)
MGTIVRILAAAGAALLLTWIGLLVALWVTRPARARATEAMRLLPDAIRLLRRLAADRSLHRGVRLRLWLLLAYLAFPIDLVPDFLPVIGYADDVVIVGMALRSVVRRAGPDAVRQLWPGTSDGLAALWSLLRLPGRPDDPYAPPAEDPELEG